MPRKNICHNLDYRGFFLVEKPPKLLPHAMRWNSENLSTYWLVSFLKPSKSNMRRFFGVNERTAILSLNN